MREQAEREELKREASASRSPNPGHTLTLVQEREAERKSRGGRCGRHINTRRNERRRLRRRRGGEEAEGRPMLRIDRGSSSSCPLIHAHAVSAVCTGCTLAESTVGTRCQQRATASNQRRPSRRASLVVVHVVLLSPCVSPVVLFAYYLQFVAQLILCDSAPLLPACLCSFPTLVLISFPFLLILIHVFSLSLLASLSSLLSISRSLSSSGK